VIIFRSESGDLHREGQPAIETDRKRMWFWNNRLHRSSGYAVEVLDKKGETIPLYSQYWWRGIRIPPVVWQESSKCDPKYVLTLSNLEIRRSMVERIGMDKFIKKCKVLDAAPAKPGLPDGDKLYVLDTKRKGDEKTEGNDHLIVFLYLTNHSVEPDGSYKKYTLRVPPTTKTVEEGLNWAAGVGPRDKIYYVFES